MAAFSFITNIIAPKKKAKTGGASATATFNPQTADRVLTLPQFRDHLTDIFDSRQADDARVLMKQLFVHDPDVSASVNGWLTMANTDATILVRDLDGEIDRDATKGLMQAIDALSRSTDYTLGFQLKKNLKTMCEELRYLLLLRGAIGAELIFDKQLMPSFIRNVDMASVEWYEKKAGEYKPVQKIAGSGTETSLDTPTFFVSHFRKDPTTIYGASAFVSAINTIAARQQVINDLYRIMRRVGFPRMDVKVVEEVLVKNAPADVKADQEKLKTWILARMGEVRGLIETLRSDQALIHMDSVETTILNDQGPGAAMDITSVIETLNAQNQAGLKTMATVIGRGAAGANTGSVEARIAAMNADELNEPVSELLSNIFSFILHMQGYQGFAYVTFRKAELRPELELEPQLLLRNSRLRTDLSDGLITDDEYHLLMYGRLRPDASPELSGTKFMTPAPAEGGTDAAGKVSTNGDSLAGPGKAAKTTKSNGVKPKTKS